VVSCPLIGLTTLSPEPLSFQLATLSAAVLRIARA
jgi:hypothetical protein